MDDATSDLLWANLIHLSHNMWCDRPLDDQTGPMRHIVAQPFLRFDEGLWDELVEAMHGAGVNAVVLDLGDGIRYESHPEIAVDGAWTPERLRSELKRLRALGMEPIPKLNFSTAHDAWLGPYARMVSTRDYYRVCADLICEVSELFDRPRLFHLGMDEETAEHQRNYAYAVMRQHDLWWDDLLFYVAEVERMGSRAWIWSDYVWHHPEMFYARMPRNVVQSNWYYGTSFDAEPTSAEPEAYEYARAYLAYRDMSARGFDQIPTGSNWSTPSNFEGTVRYCLQHVRRDGLMGFLQTPWLPTLPDCRDRHLAAIEQIAAARRLVAGSQSDTTAASLA